VGVHQLIMYRGQDISPFLIDGNSKFCKAGFFGYFCSDILDYENKILLRKAEIVAGFHGHLNSFVKYTRHMAYIDNSIIPDAEFGCDTRWLLPGEKSKEGQLLMKPHTLPHGTSIVLNAMNYADITDLCAEVEFWIGGEKHIINKSFGAYIPPNVEQGPMIIRNIKKQIFFMLSYPIGEGIKKYPGG